MEPSHGTLTPTAEHQRKGETGSGDGDQPQARIDGDDPVGPEPAAGQVKVEPAAAAADPTRGRDHPATHRGGQTVAPFVVVHRDVVVEDGSVVRDARLRQGVEQDRREHRHQVDGDHRGRLPAPVGPQRPQGQVDQAAAQLGILDRSSIWARWRCQSSISAASPAMSVRMKLYP